MKVVVFNKPFDVLSQFREDEKHLTVSSFIKDPELRDDNLSQLLKSKRAREDSKDDQ